MNSKFRWEKKEITVDTMNGKMQVPASVSEGLAVHASLNGESGWAISHVRSGLSLMFPRFYDKKEDAIRATEYILANSGVDWSLDAEEIKKLYPTLQNFIPKVLNEIIRA